MKNLKWKILIPLVLIITSAGIYYMHYVLFHDAHHIFVYLVGDIAFIPLEVLLVTVIIDKLLDWREKQKVLNKLNMIIGIFFSEAGREIFKIFKNADSDFDKLTGNMTLSLNSTKKELNSLSLEIKKMKWKSDVRNINLVELSRFLKSKRDFFMKMLENPVLLEHETFTELMRAVFHLEDEFIHRLDASNMSEDDMEHIQIDINRVYSLLVYEWFEYMKYLKTTHPYLFAFSVKTNPVLKVKKGY